MATRCMRFYLIENIFIFNVIAAVNSREVMSRLYIVIWVFQWEATTGCARGLN